MVQSLAGPANGKAMTFRATCITLFPDAFPGILGVSIVGTALRQGIWELDTVRMASANTAMSTTRLPAAAPAWFCGLT